MPTSVPLYEAKAELFRTLGHPTRIRVLEILQRGPTTVREMLEILGLEPSTLSQQLAVLRRAGLVSSHREASTVRYALATPDVADLLATGRRILGSTLANSRDLLDELGETS